MTDTTTKDTQRILLTPGTSPDLDPDTWKTDQRLDLRARVQAVIDYRKATDQPRAHLHTVIDWILAGIDLATIKRYLKEDIDNHAWKAGNNPYQDIRTASLQAVKDYGRLLKSLQ